MAWTFCPSKVPGLWVTDISIAEAHLYRERVADCKVSETRITSLLLHHSSLGEVIIQKPLDWGNTLCIQEFRNQTLSWTAGI